VPEKRDVADTLQQIAELVFSDGWLVEGHRWPASLTYPHIGKCGSILATRRPIVSGTVAVVA